jgi:hypothetical protein
MQGRKKFLKLYIILSNDTGMTSGGEVVKKQKRQTK